MRTFAIAAIVCTAYAKKVTAPAATSATSNTYFHGVDPPKCHIKADGTTVIHYDGKLHPSFKCSHVGAVCSCVSKHPTHHKGLCKEFSSVGNDPTHTLSGDCGGTGANPPTVAPAIGTTPGTQCPGGGKATAAGCSTAVVDGHGWGDFWEKKCNTHGGSSKSIAVPSGHRFMQVTMVCRELMCTSTNTVGVYPTCPCTQNDPACYNNCDTKIGPNCGWPTGWTSQCAEPKVSSVLKDAEMTFDKTTPCTGKCGSSKAQCTPESSFTPAGSASTVFGPIPAGTSWSTFGEQCNGNCGIQTPRGNNKFTSHHGATLASAWAYYKSAECFSGSHCASGTCTNNVCA